MIQLQHVYKEYQRGPQQLVAIRDLSLTISQGEFCAVMGPSGSGKSTLLHLIAGLDVVSAGDIVLDGQSSGAFGDHEWTQWRRKHIGVVFQAFHLIPGLTIEDNVSLPLRLRGESPKTTHGTRV